MMDVGKLLQCVIVFLTVFLSGVYLLQYAVGNKKGCPVDVSGKLAGSSVPSKTPAWSGEEDPFSEDFPDQTKILLDTPSSKGWKQMGEFPVDYGDSCEMVHELMRGRGYTVKQTVSDPKYEGRCLSQWESPGGKKILWSLWRVQANRTGFSWGESK